jgi:HlyD family secretion protein
MTTLDAYGNSVVFNNSIVKIDPAATVIDGVPTYKVTLKFDVKDDRVRSGMTANLDILTNKKDNVLFLPSRVIVTKDDGKYVSMLDANDKSELIEKKVITGLRGSDGNVEVISGLNEGDKVVAL